jgi:2-keto-4-pentenoate hydratase/2-oxohepta-3-ene-1,7-dioic acid hydratase in catechol pathway
MRWIRFTADNKTAYGILEAERVTEVTGDPFNGYEKTKRVHALASVKLEVPVIPRTFYCAGLNYVSHVAGMAAHGVGKPNIPTQPDIAYRGPSALIAHNETIVIPRDATEKVQYEGELVVVIGKKVKNLSEADALGCVFGYTIGNDVSERTWQTSDRTNWRAKNSDTFNPMGPWIETDVNLDAMETIVRLNGTERTRFKTNSMLFGIARFISTMSRYMTLYPSDVIWMGTDGVPPNLKDGDVVEVEITGIGILRNPIARAV